jgi:hypothetical protein
MSRTVKILVSETADPKSTYGWMYFNKTENNLYLFICGLFNYGIRSSDDVAYTGRIINQY